MNKALADRVEYAILEIITGPNPDEDSHQATFGDWKAAVNRTVTELQKTGDLLAALKRLQKEHVIELWKYDADAQNKRRQYSGRIEDDNLFFRHGPFSATITDEGRRHSDRLRTSQRNGVFISHITQEKPVALVLQKYLKLAFGDDFRVFVSSDAKSIGGGRKWYTHIIENLRMSEVVLVLVSQESKGREWINFEAGFGEGLESLVIPVGVNNMSLGQLPNPLGGIQGRRIDEIGAIVDDIGGRLGMTPATIDAKAFSVDLQEAEAALTYRSVTIEPVAEGKYLKFDISNVGNVDLELLMLEVLLPTEVDGNYTPFPGDGLDVSVQFKDNVRYRSYACYSGRGTYKGITPMLRPILTPSMGIFRPNFNVPIRGPLTDAQKELSILFQIHAVNYRTDAEKRRIADIGGWGR